MWSSQMHLLPQMCSPLPHSRPAVRRHPDVPAPQPCAPPDMSSPPLPPVQLCARPAVPCPAGSAVPSLPPGAPPAPAAGECAPSPGRAASLGRVLAGFPGAGTEGGPGYRCCSPGANGESACRQHGARRGWRCGRRVPPLRREHPLPIAVALGQQNGPTPCGSLSGQADGRRCRGAVGALEPAVPGSACPAAALCRAPPASVLPAGASPPRPHPLPPFHPHPPPPQFDAEFRRFAMKRTGAGSFQEFYCLLQTVHQIPRVDVLLGYTDVHGDLLPINNDDNYHKALSSANPLLRVIIQKKGKRKPEKGTGSVLPVEGDELHPPVPLVPCAGCVSSCGSWSCTCQPPLRWRDVEVVALGGSPSPPKAVAPTGALPSSSSPWQRHPHQPSPM